MASKISIFNVWERPRTANNQMSMSHDWIFHFWGFFAFRKTYLFPSAKVNRTEIENKSSWNLLNDLMSLCLSVEYCSPSVAFSAYEDRDAILKSRLGCSLEIGWIDFDLFEVFSKISLLQATFSRSLGRRKKSGLILRDSKARSGNSTPRLARRRFSSSATTELSICRFRFGFFAGIFCFMTDLFFLD